MHNHSLIFRAQERSTNISHHAEVGHVAAVVAAIMHTLDPSWLRLATRPSFSEMLGELETVLEELLRAMSAEDAAQAAHEVTAAIREGCPVDKPDELLEEAASLLALLDEVTSDVGQVAPSV
eukprot:COSAG01_NODE_3868_length_5606_cov_2.027601_6_plen_122_part_00